MSFQQHDPVSTGQPVVSAVWAERQSNCFAWRPGPGCKIKPRLIVGRDADSQDNHRKTGKVAGPAEPWVPSPALRGNRRGGRSRPRKF